MGSCAISRRRRSRACRDSPISIMPADLQKVLTAQDLADVVDYMLTLREARVTSGAKKQ